MAFSFLVSWFRALMQYLDSLEDHYILKIVLAIWDLQCFHKDFRIICFSAVKNAICILIEIALTL